MVPPVVIHGVSGMGTVLVAFPLRVKFFVQSTILVAGTNAAHDHPLFVMGLLDPVNHTGSVNRILLLPLEFPDAALYAVAVIVDS